MIYGVDVSHYQGDYDFPNNLAFAFAKATEGVTYDDDKFARNWSRMKSEGLIRGAYHFGRPGNDPESDARHFLSVVRGRGLADGDLLALDLEVSDGRSASSVAGWARSWCTYVTDQTGRKPIVYTFISFARDGHCSGLGSYPLWIAAPSYDAGHPPVPVGPWSTWVIHQYSSSPVDKDVSRLTADELRALGDPTPEDDMPDYVSVGMTKAQEFPTDTWTTLEFDTEYSDDTHQHADEGGASVVVGPARYSLNAFVTVTGLPAGAEGQIRLTRVATDDSGDRQSGPIQEFVASSGDTYLTYTIAVDAIDDGRKTRVELIHWAAQAAQIQSAQLKCLVWH